MQRIVHCFGCPDLLVSDNGKQFRSRIFAATLKDFGVHHRTTPLYSHCNPVERTNKTIKTMIAQYVERNHRRWDQHIFALQFAYNTARHEATEYTPAYLNFGRELSLPHPDDCNQPREKTPTATWRRHLEEARELARISLAHAFQRQEPHYNLRRRNWRPQMGDLGPFGKRLTRFLRKQKA